MQTGLSTWDELVQAISIGLGIVFSCIFFNPVSLSHLQHLYIAYASYMSSHSISLRLALGNNLFDILAAAFEYCALKIVVKNRRCQVYHPRLFEREKRL